MVRLLIALLAGILLGRLCSLWWPGALLATLALFAQALALQRKQPYAQRWVPGLLINLAILGIGWSLATVQDSRKQAAHFQYALSASEQQIVGRVLQQALAGRRLKLVVQVQAIQDTHSGLQPSTGQLLAYLPLPPPGQRPVSGDVLLLRGRIQPIRPPHNPDQFDYRRYLAVRDIHHQTFADTAWTMLSHDPNLYSYAALLRQHALRTLQAHLPTPNEFAVGAALTLGYKSALTEDIENAYANTGAMHVLAVSGLHVGLVQLLLTWLLGRLPIQRRWWAAARTILIILCIWGFALVTGASPSVLRAATMFSFLAAGLALKRTTNIYNTLAASAFLLLLINPNLVYHVGFQLSYLAVLGIVYFQPRIYSLWHIDNRLGDYLWQLAAVSLAAQLGTLPISLYYFHQFPVYFVLSGLVVVPAAAVILTLTLLLLVLQGVAGIGVAVGQVLYGLIFAVNSAIFLIQQLPGNLVEGIWISGWAAILLYALLAAFVLAYRTRAFSWVLVGLAALVALTGQRAWFNWQRHQQQALVVYHLYKQTAVDGFSGRIAVEVSSPGLLPDALAFAAQQHRWRRGTVVTGRFACGEPFRSATAYAEKGFLHLGGHRLFLLQDAHDLQGQAPTGIPVHAVLLCNSVEASLESVLHYVDTPVVIADGSNPPWRVRQWESEAAALMVPFYCTARDGAITLENGKARAFLQH